MVTDAPKNNEWENPYARKSCHRKNNGGRSPKTSTTGWCVYFLSIDVNVNPFYSSLVRPQKGIDNWKSVNRLTRRDAKNKTTANAVIRLSGRGFQHVIAQCFRRGRQLPPFAHIRFSVFRLNYPLCCP